MMQFHKNNIGEEWMGLANEFSEFIFQPSPELLDWVDHCKSKGFDGVPTTENLVNLRYGFECGIGWKNIIWEYFTSIRNLIKEAKDNGHDISYSPFIFKEKFAQLLDQGDFYGADASIYRDRYYELGNIMSEASLETCEVCGKPGKSRGKSYGWVKTICDDHAIELNYT
jgi:hypothetical protein